jgi:hypothetical protein
MSAKLQPKSAMKKQGNGARSGRRASVAQSESVFETDATQPKSHNDGSVDFSNPIVGAKGLIRRLSNDETKGDLSQPLASNDFGDGGQPTVNPVAIENVQGDRQHGLMSVDMRKGNRKAQFKGGEMLQSMDIHSGRIFQVSLQSPPLAFVCKQSTATT